MNVLLDHNVPRTLRCHLPGHDVRTARAMGWDRLQNGRLIASAAAGGFDVFLSLDKKIEYEHNLSALPLAVVLLDAPTNSLASLVSFVPAVLGLFATPVERGLYWIARDGSVTRLTRPR